MTVYYKAFDFADGLTVYKRNLPHWRQTGCAYFVTFRLVDSILQHLLREWDMVRQGWLANHPRPWNEDDIAEYNRKFTAQMEQYLHNGYGSCILRRKKVALIVEAALRHFDGERYHLGDYVVMPNHVHLIVVPKPGFQLEKLGNVQRICCMENQPTIEY